MSRCSRHRPPCPIERQRRCPRRTRGGPPSATRSAIKVRPSSTGIRTGQSTVNPDVRPIVLAASSGSRNRPKRLSLSTGTSIADLRWPTWDSATAVREGECGLALAQAAGDGFLNTPPRPAFAGADLRHGRRSSARPRPTRLAARQTVLRLARVAQDRSDLGAAQGRSALRTPNRTAPSRPAADAIKVGRYSAFLAGPNERWQESGPVIRRVLNLPRGNPPTGHGASKSAAGRRRRRAA
jgi:hypothetical protein